MGKNNMRIFLNENGHLQASNCLQTECTEEELSILLQQVTLTEYHQETVCFTTGETNLSRLTRRIRSGWHN